MPPASPAVTLDDRDAVDWGWAVGGVVSSSSGRRSKTALANDAAIRTTGPEDISGPATMPPTSCPCAPERNIERPPEPGGAGGGRTVPVRERISKRPCRVTGADGCRMVTLVTAPVPLRTQTPRPRRRAYTETLSTTSFPAETSRTSERRALGVSRVTTIGGLGLFLDPGGLPRGRRPPEVVGVPPELVVAKASVSFSGE